MCHPQGNLFYQLNQVWSEVLAMYRTGLKSFGGQAIVPASHDVDSCKCEIPPVEASEISHARL
jgi:hypothetical protein